MNKKDEVSCYIESSYDELKKHPAYSGPRNYLSGRLHGKIVAYDTAKKLLDASHVETIMQEYANSFEKWKVEEYDAYTRGFITGQLEAYQLISNILAPREE